MSDNQHLFIRTDSSVDIGIGHVMRCFALAQEWQRKGGRVTFVSKCESEELQKRIVREGFRFLPLNKTLTENSDLRQTTTFLKSDSSVQWIVIDGYHFCPEYQKSISETGVKVLVVDDFNHQECYYADILLNQNINSEEMNYHCSPNTIKLLGCNYIMLRRDFLVSRKRKFAVPQKAKRIMLTMGGADPDNATQRILSALNQMDNLQYFDIKIIVGPTNPHLDTLKTLCSESLCNCEICYNVKDIQSIMLWADFVITAGGSTCWELAFVGVPMIITVLSENQVGIAQFLSFYGAGINMGWLKECSTEEISLQVHKLACAQDVREKQIRSSHGLIDGGGTQRIVDIMRRHIDGKNIN